MLVAEVGGQIVVNRFAIVAALVGLAEQFQRLAEVLRHALAGGVQHAVEVERLVMLRLGGAAQPLGGLGEVLRHAVAFVIQHAKIELGACVARLSHREHLLNLHWLAPVY